MAIPLTFFLSRSRFCDYNPSMHPENPLGRVVATELKPSTPHQFHFWTARETPIGIGAIVRVEENGRVVRLITGDSYVDRVN